MAKKESIFKRIFSKSDKDCCSVEIEEVDSDANVSRYDEIKSDRENKKQNSNTNA